MKRHTERLEKRAPLGAALLAVLAFGGCADEPDPYTPVADVKDLMLSVLEPAAEVYWDAVGEILDSAGVHEIRPETDEDWEAVRNAAFVIAESGNLLLMSGRALDRGEWTGMSQRMIETGQLALRAADNRSIEGVFDAGAEVYYACTECHVRYAQETLRPNDTRLEETSETASDAGAEDAADEATEPGS